MNKLHALRITSLEAAFAAAVFILVALALTPAVVQARSRGAVPTLQSGIRQSMTALALYSQDYDERRPSGNWTGGATMSSAGNPGDCKLEDSQFQSLDGGCKDLTTGKVWSLPGYDATAQYYNQSNASLYCAGLVEGGMSDWRLPTKEEAQAVFSHGGQYHLAGRNDDAKWTITTRGNKGYWVNPYNGTLALALSGGRLDMSCVRP